MREYLGPTAVALSLVLLSGCAARRSAEVSAQPPARTMPAATIEALDPGLAAALLAERLLPIVENHLQVAREYQRLGILDGAAARIGRALVRAPRSAVAHEAMARVWRDWGLPGSALGYAHRAIYFDARSASAHNTLGTVLDALGRSDEALRAYARALALDPTAAWALNNQCSLEFRLGRLEDAIGHCEAAVRMSPTLAAAHNNLGLTHAASGNLVRAADAFLAAGNEAAAHYNVGIVHLAHGRYAAAGVAFEEAIKARPAFTAAKTRAHDARMRALTTR